MRRAQGKDFRDVTAEWRNRPGYLFLNGDVVEEIRQLSGAGGKGTVDELGFLVLYDRIAERLFPWCSTLTSRAGYFFYSLAVIDIALRGSIEAKQIDPNRDASELPKAAERARTTFMRNLRRLERALALSLVAKHAANENGIFGSRRCRRWFRDNVKVSRPEKILSSDARFPNAIYRGACRALGMFSPRDSSTTGLLRAKLAGAQIFDEEWYVHSKSALTTVQRLGDFWRFAEVKNWTFSKAQAEIEKLPAFETFGGFGLSEDEARFLYTRIQRATSYLAEIPLSKLASTIGDSDLDLLSLKAAISDPSKHELFEAGYHIDAVTTPYREMYRLFSRDRESVGKFKFPLKQVQESKDWLDARCKKSALDWAPVWKDQISPLIDDWLAISNSNGKSGALLDGLCERAEQVVRGRGQGKQAPHEKEPDGETDLKSELDVRETSFRLGNGTLILRDIANGIRA